MVKCFLHNSVPSLAVQCGVLLCLISLPAAQGVPGAVAPGLSDLRWAFCTFSGVTSVTADLHQLLPLPCRYRRLLPPPWSSLSSPRPWPQSHLHSKGVTDGSSGDTRKRVRCQVR